MAPSHAILSACAPLAAGPAALLAQAGGAAQQQSSPFSLLFMFVPLLVIMYFFMIRPQQKRQKEHDAMLRALQTGERIVTTGGIVGTIVRTEENTDQVRIRIAPSVEVTVLRSYIAGKVKEETQ